MTRNVRSGVLFAVLAAAAAGAFLLAPIPQDLYYHDFADQRTLLGIPNFWNVARNLPFLFVGQCWRSR